MYEFKSQVSFSTSEAVECPALPLESVHHVHGSHGLALGVLGVGHSVTYDILKKNLENSPGLFIDEAGDPLDSTPAGQPPDGGLGDALDVVPQDLPVPLGSSLSQSLSSLAAA